MTQLSESNSDYRSRRRPITEIPIQESHHDAVTSIRSNSTTNYINITEILTDFVFEHAKSCKNADRELEAILRQHRQGGANTC